MLLSTCLGTIIGILHAWLALASFHFRPIAITPGGVVRRFFLRMALLFVCLWASLSLGADPRGLLPFVIIGFFAYVSSLLAREFR